MIEIILFAIGILGFGAAAYFDLRYTEFADWLPYGMIISALAIRGIFAAYTGNLLIITNSVLFGLLFLALGMGLYFTKQWGDGDAWLLGAMGFLFPDKESMLFLGGFSSNIPFYLALIFNLFLISLFYILAYTIVLGAKNKKVGKEFSSSLRKNRKSIYGVTGLFFAVLIVFTFYFGLTSAFLFHFYSAVGILYALFFFVQYTKVIESKVFVKKISTKDLREGDVLVQDKWRGLTKKELAKLKKTKRFVYIKEGIRFAPVFILAVLATALYGGLLFLVV